MQQSHDELTRSDFETINRICDFLDIDLGDLLSFKKIRKNN
ncbi:helix-turn-helix transcriptional regulator [Acinetobacter sp. A3.8]|uniref:Helix-turn-helix transcriptional regulator n=1 Tax=Acinetobacter sedimenti TaxID=2919922 RepID=A0A9X2B7R7_9GAMM|nr:helix-turn-helix transcriptional regulator [Acinetobacter sedimenti]MCJ8147412.1 helix-turn-helix transcriptional regulator [Acinetobacter sedimenti]